jgi:hypothetical protein
VRLDNLKVEMSPNLRLTFMVKGAFKKGIVEAIHSGIPTSFTFFVKLYKVKTLWPDEGIGSWQFNHTVKYDALKEEYEIQLDERSATVKTKSFEEMKAFMVSGNNIPITPAPHLIAGLRYKLRVKAELDKIELPLFLDDILFFVKLWDFETSWHSILIEPAKPKEPTKPEEPAKPGETATPAEAKPSKPDEPAKAGPAVEPEKLDNGTVGVEGDK